MLWWRSERGIGTSIILPGTFGPFINIKLFSINHTTVQIIICNNEIGAAQQRCRENKGTKGVRAEKIIVAITERRQKKMKRITTNHSIIN